MAFLDQEKAGRKRREMHWLFRYGLALVLFAGIIGLSLLLNRLEIRLNLTIPIVLTLFAAAWFGGFGPGLLISVLFQATTILYTKIPEGSTAAKAAFGYFSVFSLYVFLAYMISRFRKIQNGLREHRDLLQVTLTSIGDAVIATDTNGMVTFMNPAAEKMTGWHLRDAGGLPLTEVVQIINEETREAVKNPVEKVMETGEMVGLANHSVLVAKDGREVPIDDSAAPIKEKGKIRGVILVIADVTERKIAQRSTRDREIMNGVVEAQEAERRRIARDLHDHLGQKMTALRLRLESLSDGFEGTREQEDTLDEVQSSATQIDRDIGFLSWELRPTELENFGLADALKSFVREWSQQYDINAEFQTSKVDPGSFNGRMPHAIETNLYRITQEALNNALKHSAARNVNVLLQHQENHVVLIVEDDGCGFDLETTSTNGSGPRGLGLLGMKERAAIMNGTLEIDSEPDCGTTVVVRVPLSAVKTLGTAAGKK